MAKKEKQTYKFFNIREKSRYEMTFVVLCAKKSKSVLKNVFLNLVLASESFVFHRAPEMLFVTKLFIYYKLVYVCVPLFRIF